jgi:hypothetical protein
MKKSVDMQTIAPVDVAQRYTIAEAVLYLRISHASIYKEINARRLRVLKLGRRTFVPGSEIGRLSRLAGTQDAPLSLETAVPAKPRYNHLSVCGERGFPRPRKFGRSSLWVTAEVNDWIAKRTAGVPIEIDEVSNSVPG